MGRRGKTVAIVQARFASERLPGKVLADLGGRCALDLVLERVARARSVDELWLACSDSPADDPIAACAARHGVAVFRGDEQDVLSRFVAVAGRAQADAIVRVTSDCPFVDPDVLDTVAGRFHDVDADFVSNTLHRSYPDGLDVEVFTEAALRRTDAEAKLPFLRAHVTPYIHGRLKDRLPWGGFSNVQVVQPQDFSHMRWTLDEEVDLAFFRRTLARLPADFGWLDVIAVCTAHPELLNINRHHRTYEGTERDLRRAHLPSALDAPRRFDESDRFFARARSVIPLASQTFSKSYQQHVVGAAPLFLERGRGCRVEDIDGNSYIDYVLGLLPVILGYGDPDVDAAIVEQLGKGITFSLPSPLETELAERLVRIIPCAEMVRFGKNGSDATTGAIRLARAHTGRERIAICGYHGWHDWYIGTTTRDLGVPRAVRALSETFRFNDLDGAEALISGAPDGFAAIVLEPAGVREPAPGFLEGLRALCDKYGVVLVFDEIVTGLRIDLGGAQAAYGVTPDLACFGKALGNGMPISAVVGRRDIMAKMEDIFFSGTFGGEALSLAAAIATLDKLQATDGVARLKALGARLKSIANACFAEHDLSDWLAMAGPDWWPRLAIANPPFDAVILNSLLRQEFAANGLLMASSFNLCLAHDSAPVVEETAAALGAASAAVRAALQSDAPERHLRGAPIQPTFSVR